jgi:hypothetical protein
MNPGVKKPLQDATRIRARARNAGGALLHIARSLFLRVKRTLLESLPEKSGCWGGEHPLHSVFWLEQEL